MFTTRRITIVTEGVRCQETDFPEIEYFPRIEITKMEFDDVPLSRSFAPKPII
jgi:hypothetical protein